MTETATNIIAAIKNYSGQSQEVLIERLDILPAHGVKKPKNINKLIIDKILFTSGVTNDYGHRRKEDILIRNCAISPRGKLQDPLSFRTFSFLDVSVTPYEDSEIFKDWTKEIVLVVWKKESSKRGAAQILWDVKLVRIPNSVLFGECKNMYLALQKRVQNGDIYKLVGGEILSNLPSATESAICHVRPKAQKGADQVSLPVPDKITGAKTMTRQCFWLNKEFIKRFL